SPFSIIIARRPQFAFDKGSETNSQLAMNLFQLGHYYYDSSYIKRVEKMLTGRLDELVSDPLSNANWGRLAIMMEKGLYEMAITGSDALVLRKEMANNYLPNAISLGTLEDENLLLLENKVKSGKSVIYVCQNKSCRLPVTNVSQALELMQ
ncbi:MAG: thioredoxin domain-containing protein, partial [Bacteroidota bacterium]